MFGLIIFFKFDFYKYSLKITKNYISIFKLKNVKTTVKGDRMGTILKILIITVLLYIIFIQLDRRYLNRQKLTGVLKSKFMERDSAPQTHFNSSLAYFKEKEKYFATLQVGEYLTTEQVTKDIYSKLVIDEQISLVKYYTKLTNKLIKIEIND